MNGNARDGRDAEALQARFEQLDTTARRLATELLRELERAARR